VMKNVNGASGVRGILIAIPLPGNILKEAGITMPPVDEAVTVLKKLYSVLKK